MADLVTIPALKSAIKTRVYTNENFDVSAQRIQDSFIDTIDTLKSIGVINSTYEGLTTLVNNNELQPKVFYSFEYETTSLVQGTGILLSNKDNPDYPTDGIKETLILQAVSTSTFSSNAVSVNYPNDEIKYDFTEDFVELGGGVYTTIPSQGRINFRKTDKNVSAYFDVRNNWVTLYGLDYSNSSALVDYPTIQSTPVEKDKGDIIYLENSPLSHFDDGYYLINRDVDDLANKISNPANVNYMTSISVFEQQFFTKYVLNTLFELDNTTITYHQSIDLSNCKDITVGKSYSNYVFLTNSSSVDIEEDCINVSINDSVRVKIGSDCNTGIVVSGSSSVSIGSSSSAITVSYSAGLSLGNSNSVVTIEDIEEVKTSESIGDVKVLQSNGLEIGSKCSGITVNNSDDNILSLSCSNIFFHNSDFNNFDQKCSSIALHEANNNKFGANCSFIDFLGGRDSEIGGEGYISNYSNMDFNTFGRGCENIVFNSLGGRGNTFGDECKNISFRGSDGLLSGGDFAIGCTFCRGIQNKTFDAAHLVSVSFLTPCEVEAVIPTNKFYEQILEFIIPGQPLEDEFGVALAQTSSVKIAYSASNIQQTALDDSNHILIGHGGGDSNSESRFFNGGTSDPASPSYSIRETVWTISNKAYIWTANGYPLNATLSLGVNKLEAPAPSLNNPLYIE